jgi:hypothetical protein
VCLELASAARWFGDEQVTNTEDYRIITRIYYQLLSMFVVFKQSRGLALAPLLHIDRCGSVFHMVLAFRFSIQRMRCEMDMHSSHFLNRKP